jgi:hypothetical protein
MDKDQGAFAHPQDPQEKYPKPPFKKQKQPWPGLACKMEPPPEQGADHRRRQRHGPRRGHRFCS